MGPDAKKCSILAAVHTWCWLLHAPIVAVDPAVALADAHPTKCALPSARRLPEQPRTSWADSRKSTRSSTVQQHAGRLKEQVQAA